FSLKVNSIGDEVCRPAYRDALTSFLAARADQMCDEHRERWSQNPLRVLDCKREACRRVTEDAPRTIDHLCDACSEHFGSVREGLEEEGIAFEVDDRLVRGLDYYTRTAFEFVSEVLGPTQSTICGGGRYDGLAEVLGGPPTPGIGFGLGLERALLVLQEQEGESGLAWSSGPEVFVVAMGEGGAAEGRRLVRELRASGIRADRSLEDRPMKAQLKMADRTEAWYAAIVGEQELADGTVTMRAMRDGKQERVKRSEVVGWLRTR
ncbi:MAG TPA: His/Gly/Thr/Pro-type tRNA ligase C-terminal domain-containing protein, partial [Actinomycetota bacterium]|nr:His/Gly/Thr/Pro-type tRNA ligase C-terminal domain-containing protein [Actinomycetota bacterium]